MVMPYDCLALEVDTSPVRNYIRDDTGADAGRGWRLTDMAIVSNSTEACAVDGYAFTGGGNGTASMSTVIPIIPGMSLAVGCRFKINSPLMKLVVTATYITLDGDPSAATPITESAPGETGAMVGTMPVPENAAFVMITIAGDRGGAWTVGQISACFFVDPGTPVTVPSWAPRQWTSILSKTTRITGEGGNVLDGVEDILTAGYLTVVNRDPALDPSVSPVLKRGRVIRLRAVVDGVTYPIWRGSIESAPVSYQADGTPVTTISATDAAREVVDTAVGVIRGTSTTTSAAMVNYVALMAGKQVPFISMSKSVLARDSSGKGNDWVRRVNNRDGTRSYVDATDDIITKVPSATVWAHLTDINEAPPVGTRNLLRNPAPATADNWSAVGGALSLLTYADTTKALRLTASSAQVAGAAQIASSTTFAYRAAVTPGSRYTFQAQARSGTGGIPVRCQIRWWDSAGNSLSVNPGDVYGGTADYADGSVTAIAPATAATATCQVISATAMASGQTFDARRFMFGTGYAKTYVDGNHPAAQWDGTANDSATVVTKPSISYLIDGLELSWGGESIVNVLSVTDYGATDTKAFGPYVATASAAESGRVTADIQTLTLRTPYDRVKAILAPFAPQRRFPWSVQMDPMRDADVLKINAYDLLRVERKGIYDGTARALRIKHEITPTRWRTTVYTRPDETAAAVVVAYPSAGKNTGPADATS